MIKDGGKMSNQNAETGDIYQVFGSHFFSDGSIIKIGDDEGIFGTKISELIHGYCNLNLAPGWEPGAFDTSATRVKLENLKDGKTAGQLGVQEGDVFVATEDNFIFDEYSLVELQKDDNSTAPLFKLIKGDCRYNNGGNGQKGGFAYLKHFVKVPASLDIKTKGDDMNILQKLERANELEEHAQELEKKVEEIRCSRQEIVDEIQGHLPNGWSIINEETASRKKSSTNWRNWEVGDKLECIKSNDDFLEGEILEVIEKEDDGYEGSLPVLLENTRTKRTSWPCIEDGDEFFKSL